MARPLCLLPLLALALASPAAHRVHNSPFPVSPNGAPNLITVVNLTGATFDERILALSAVGVVAQRDSARLATVDALDAHAAGGVAAWHLSLLPVDKDFSLQFELGKAIEKFTVGNGNLGCIPGYILASPTNLHVAVSLAGVLGGVVATESVEALAKAAGLALLVDARTLDLEETFDKFEPLFSRTLLFNQVAAKLEYTMDFAVFGKAFAMFDAKLAGTYSQTPASYSPHYMNWR